MSTAALAPATLNPGTAVNWRPHPNSTPIRTAIRSLETITRNSGERLQLAALECNRLVPVTELEPIIGDAAKSLELPAKSPELPRPKHQSSQDENTGLGTARMPAATPSKPAAAVQPPAAAAPAAGECRILAIDFLNLLVRAWHAGKPTDSHAVRSLFQTMAAAVRALNPQHVVFALDGGYDHRTALFADYKAHRPPSDPGLVLQRQLAEQALAVCGLQAIRVVGFEADDVLASLALQHGGVVICSSDKDLLALCGRARVYHPWSGGSFVTAEDKLGVPAGRVTDYLALCGDASDGVPGVSGIGPKTAVALLADHGSLESILTAARLRQIPGATGRKLAEQTDAALLSHKLIELRSTLPLPDLQPWRPRSGWQQLLQDLRLSSVAAIMESIVPQLTAGRSDKTTPQDVALSASTGKDERAGAVVSGNPESPQAAVESRSLNQVETSPISAGRTDSTGSSVGAVPASGVASSRVFRSLREPLITANRTVHDNWSGPDGGMILCWEKGRTAAPGSTCPWKSDSPQFTAWHQGRRGEDLDVIPPAIPRPQVPGVPGKTAAAYGPDPAAVRPAPAPPTKPAQRSLF